MIVCGLRTLDPTVSRAMAEIAAEYAGDGVVAFDLAGAERGHPARDHADAFAIAAEAGLHITCHAGEGAGPESILDALEHCRPQRIGHGVRVREDPALMARLRDEGIPLEMCPTSNVHTRAVRDVHDHPLRAYFDAGLTVTINTDSRLMDDITLTDELWLAHEHLGFGREQLDQLILNAFESAFLPPAEKDPMVAAAKRELKAIS